MNIKKSEHAGQMRSFSFSRFSPAGNDTLFLHSGDMPQPMRAKACRLAMEMVKAEQAGIAGIRSQILTMAGGEFCLNACRAFGALLKMEKGGSSHYIIEICGMKVALNVSGKAPIWQVEASFEPGPCGMEAPARGLHLVHMPGISHLLVAADDFPSMPEDAAGKLIDVYGLANRAACGVVWWRKADSGHRILPYVAVPGAGTGMVESSCGSGSLALALATGAREILQPCGEALSVAISGDVVSVSGSVTLSCMGTLWLDIDEAACA